MRRRPVGVPGTVRPALARALLGGVLGGLLGGVLGGTQGASYVLPDAVDSARWNMVTPGRDENVQTQEQGRGAQVVGGALVLTPHVFLRADHLVPRDIRSLGAVHVELAADSGPLRLILRSGSVSVPFALGVGAWRVSPGPWHAHEGPYDLRMEAGSVWVDGVVAASLASPTIELSAEEEQVRVTLLRLTDADGSTILEEDPAAAWSGRAPVVPGAALGAVLGIALGLAGTSLPGALVLAVAPIAVGFVSHRTWLALLERLYLVRLTTWDLARLALVLALLPAVVRVVAGLGLAVPERTEGGASRIPRGLLWGVVVTLAAVPASRHLEGIGWALLPIGVLTLLTPLAFARAASLDPIALLPRDAAALLVPALLGWGSGLFVTVALRFGWLAAGAGTLVRRAPRAAADALFVTALALIPAAELAARSTWLDTAWDAYRLEGSQRWRTPAPFWEAGCGAPQERRVVLFAGGSSTGGAYQFLGHPDRFFPGRVHALLCDQGVALRTTNFGDGGRDSFTISRSIDWLLAKERPDLVVLYLGVNDLLTHDSPRTRSQREAEEASRAATVRGLAALAARSRLLTAVGLLLRPAGDKTNTFVAAVPLPDAEANLRRVAAAVKASGAHLLLLTEYSQEDTARRIAPYGTMQAGLAAELPGVAFVDVAAGLAPFIGETLLLDRNHLSFAGSDRLAEVLAPEVARYAHADGE